MGIGARSKKKENERFMNMTECEYQTEVVARRKTLEAQETKVCRGCVDRLGVPCLKAWKCERLNEISKKNNRSD